MRVFKVAALALASALGLCGAAAGESAHQGLYYAVPAYLYGIRSASGAHLGYQLGKLHFRLEASVLADIKDGQPVLVAAPAMGAFYSEDWEHGIRTYQGASLGMQMGLLNSFDGLSFSLSILTGAEWFLSARKAVFIEIGSGFGYPEKDGAFNGGTVIGGGIKCFFR
jgi:hypothetical protein